MFCLQPKRHTCNSRLGSGRAERFAYACNLNPIKTEFRGLPPCSLVTTLTELPCRYHCARLRFHIEYRTKELWCRLRVFENRVSRRIFGPERGEVTGEWRKLHNEELNDLYCSPHFFFQVIKSRRMRWAGHVARMGWMRGVYRVLEGKPEGKRLLGRPRRRWKDNIKMDPQEVGCIGV